MNSVEIFPFIDHPFLPSSYEEGCGGGGFSEKHLLPSDAEYDIFMVRKIPNQP